MMLFSGEFAAIGILLKFLTEFMELTRITVPLWYGYEGRARPCIQIKWLKSMKVARPHLGLVAPAKQRWVKL